MRNTLIIRITDIYVFNFRIFFQHLLKKENFYGAVAYARKINHGHF